MKKLYTIILTMLMALTFVISPLYATETVEAATASYTTEKDNNKIYFPLNTSWTSSLKLPLNYSKGTLGGKKFYDLNTPLTAVGYGETYKLSFDSKIINAKTTLSKSTGKTHIIVSPVKKGKTTLKVTITKSGFNKVVFSTTVVVTDKELDWTTVTVSDIYKTEFSKTKEGYLPEYTKLFLFELNKYRTQVSIKEKVGESAYELKIAEETVKIMNKTNKVTKTLTTLIIDKEMQDLSDLRMKKLIKLGKSDNHAGFDKLIEDSADHQGYYIAEVLSTSTVFKRADLIMDAYKASTRHWAVLTDFKVNAVGTACFKTKSGKLMNVTMTGVYFSDGMAEKILEMESKYEYLMTPSEREYYGVDDTPEIDTYEEYSDDYDWSI